MSPPFVSSCGRSMFKSMRESSPFFELITLSLSLLSLNSCNLAQLPHPQGSFSYHPPLIWTYRVRKFRKEEVMQFLWVICSRVTSRTCTPPDTCTSLSLSLSLRTCTPPDTRTWQYNAEGVTGIYAYVLQHSQLHIFLTRILSHSHTIKYTTFLWFYFGCSASLTRSLTHVIQLLSVCLSCLPVCLSHVHKVHGEGGQQHLKDARCL